MRERPVSIETLARLCVGSIALASLVSLPGAAAEISCGGEVHNDVLINKYDLDPKSAVGQIQYCGDSPGEFRARVVFENLFPNSAYLLTLNGISRKPGNENLMKECKQAGLEGYCDLQTIATDAAGKVDKIVRYGLPPGRYRTKFLVKNATAKPLYQVILLSDQVNFSVASTNTPSVEILSPSADAQVEHTTLVNGKVSDPALAVYVLVHPLLVPSWWVQPLPSPPNRDGSWRSIVYFGTDQKGVGEHFEIMAIASETQGLLKEGEQLNDREVRQLMASHARSDLIAVRRTR